jgi:membrane fusion protein, type I secretion system
MTIGTRSKVRRSIRGHLAAGVAAVIVLTGGFGGWATTTEISGAVIAQGVVVVESNVKKVQHPTGGIVSKLLVREGSQVKAGDLLIRLDDTQIRANVAIITHNLDENAARQARDEAEREGESEITFPPDLLARMNDPQVAHTVEGERKIFEIRRSAREGQKAQLRERIAQAREEIQGAQTQYDARVRQLEWIKKELQGLNELWDKKLVPFTRVAAQEREASRLEGDRGQLLAAMAQARGKIAETELQILQVDQDMRSEVGKDLAEIRAKTAELIEKKVAAEDLLMRIDIRAPQSGLVHQLTAHTVGGVIDKGEQIMLIVPEADALMVEAKIQPEDIAEVEYGQLAWLRFSAFNQRTTPELNGTVSRVSADISTDPKGGPTYYTIRITVPETEYAKLGGLKLVPGMPVETFVQTKPRTVMSYLIRPIHDQIMRTFREK